jgi:pyruvate carboxylase
MVLPNKDYIPGISHTESLRNLAYPLDWRGVAEHIGFPCVLKDAHGGGWRDVYICHSMEELIQHYNGSGLLTMIVQAFVKWEQYVRCMVLGREHVLVMPYDPRERKYISDPGYLPKALHDRIAADALTLCRVLGYDMNTVEFAVQDGIPYAIDFMNPAPDMDINSLTPAYFEWVVEHMADMAIRLATLPRDADRPETAIPPLVQADASAAATVVPLVAPASK